MSPDRRHALAAVIVRVAATLVPGGQRDAWRSEWEGELAALSEVPPKYRRPIQRALGAFADAFWLRQRRIADFDWIDDVRHGLRQLRRYPGFALTAIGILAVGLAATVTMFSVIDQILLRPLPYPEPDRIVTVWETRQPSDEPLEVAPGNFLDWRARAQAFEFLAGAAPTALDVAGQARPEVWLAARVTPGFFEAFGVQPLAGRFFLQDEYQKGRGNVAVLGEAFWRRRFGGDLSIVGQTVRADGELLTIVGITPAAFEPRLLSATGARNIWLPKAIEEYEPRIRGTGYWAVVGRLAPGVSRAEADAELGAISRQLAAEYPRSNEKTGARVLPLRDHLLGNVQLAVRLLAGAVFLVLLIACVNVANLLLARGSAREREIAVRIALGARRARVIQQLLLESLVIATVGASAGCALAIWTLAGIARLGPATVPWLDTLHLDWRAVAFAAAMAAAVAILSGLLPAWRVARAGLATAGRNTSTGDVTQHRWRAGLVVAEVALALVLVTGATLLVRSFVGLLNVDPGFQRDRVLVAQVFASDYNPTPAQLLTFFDRTLERLSALPAVQAAGAVSAMPFSEANINIAGAFAIKGRPPVTDGEAPRAYQTIATPGYFEAMRIPLHAGRLLDARDGPEARKVAVISDSLARRYWPDADDAIGEVLALRFSGRPVEVEIVGVVGALRHDRLDEPARNELFMPLAQMPFGSMTFVLRSAGDASALLEPARQVIWAVNPAQTVYHAATLDELVQVTVTPRRFALAIILGFAIVALLLAVAGVYGVLTAIMTSRLKEVGLRVALGASRTDIARLVLLRGLAMAGVGVAVGLAGSLGAAQLLRAFLFEVTPADPVSVSLAVGLMMLAALAACYLPARRAAAADPIVVLRSE